MCRYKFKLGHSDFFALWNQKYRYFTVRYYMYIIVKILLYEIKLINISQLHSNKCSLSWKFCLVKPFTDNNSKYVIVKCFPSEIKSIAWFFKIKNCIFSIKKGVYKINDCVIRRLLGDSPPPPPPPSLYRGSTLDSPWALAPRLLSSIIFLATSLKHAQLLVF